MEQRSVIETSHKDNALNDSPSFGLVRETKTKTYFCCPDALKTGNFSDASNLTLCLLQQLTQRGGNRTKKHTCTQSHKQTNRRSKAKTCQKHFVPATPCFYSANRIYMKVIQIQQNNPCSYNPFIYPITLPTFPPLALHCRLLMLQQWNRCLCYEYLVY